MDSRGRWFGPGIVIAAAGAAFLTFRDVARHPGRALEVPDSPPAQVSDAKAAPIPADEIRKLEDDAAPAGEEQGEAERLAASMRKLVGDLEYSPGLREPLQQTVIPPPEPWRRDPVREGPPPVIDGFEPRRIRTGGGERVTLRGRDLRVVQVMFGTAPARLLGASGTAVAVEAPPSVAGPVTIAVTNDDGTWTLARTPIIYEE